MSPRKLLPYLVLFLVLAGGYAALTWHRETREAQQEEGKKVFRVQPEEIKDLALIKGAGEIRLARPGPDWEIVKPLKAAADQQVVTVMLSTLARLKKERDLGPQEDLKPFGLDQPGFTLAFSAAGEGHQLLVGAKAPGERAYYAFRDQERGVLLINAADKESLDRPLIALRDKTLMAFKDDQVKALRFRVDHLQVELSRAGPRTWRWLGHEGAVVRTDRVEALLRQLQYARVRDFVAEVPGNLTAYGLAPRPQGEVTVELEKTAAVLYLGSKAKEGVYARQGTSGPVILVDADLPGRLAQAAVTLEDRRLWRGDLSQVARVVWGPPAKPWVAVKEGDFWKLTGPDGQEVRQHAARVELALRHLQDLEYLRRLPGAPAGAEGDGVTLSDASGQVIFRLDPGSKKGGKELEVRAAAGDQPVGAVISGKDYDSWQGEMERLTLPPPQ